MSIVTGKKSDLAGLGVGDYTELERILPKNYHSLLNPKETQQATTIGLPRRARMPDGRRMA